MAWTSYAMTSRRSRIIRLFHGAAAEPPKDDRGRERSILYFALVVAVVIVASVLLYLYFNTGADAGEELLKAKTEVEKLASENQAIKEMLGTLNSQINKQRSTRILADKLEIEGVTLSNINGVLTVNGRIRNLGGLPVGDIELTAYCLDKRSTPLCEEKHVAASSDGKPLRRGQRRPFRIRIPDAPDNAKEVAVIVTGILPKED